MRGGEGFSSETLPDPDADPAADAEGSGISFDSLQFQREATLLSNAENYAASIRDDAETYVARLREEVESLNEQAEARYAEAEQVKQQAQREAEELLEQARSETEDIRKQAYEEGYAAGHEEGIRKRYEEAAPYLERMDGILETLAGFRNQVTYYAERDSVKLAVLMAKKILRQELRINRKAVWQLLAATLSELEGTGTFRVWLSADDHQFAASARPALERFLDENQALSFRARPDLSPGDVLIETDRDVIDLTFQQQFRHLEEQLDQSLSEREADLLHHSTHEQGGESGAAATTTPSPSGDE